MCLDYNKIEIETIRRKITEKVNDLNKKDFRTDPLLEASPDLSKLVKSIHSMAISHGTWIEESLRDFVRAIPDWQSEIKVRLSVKSKITEIDNIAYNSATGKVVLWECKRFWETLDGPAKLEVSDRFNFLEANKPQLEAELSKIIGKTPNAVDMVVFNCWGKERKWPKGMKTYKIYCRDEISDLFGPCIWECIEFHRDYITQTMSDLFGLQKNNTLDDNPFYNKFME